MHQIKGVISLAHMKGDSFGSFAQVNQTFDSTFTLPLILVKRSLPLTLGLLLTLLSAFVDSVCQRLGKDSLYRV